MNLVVDMLPAAFRYDLLVKKYLLNSIHLELRTNETEKFNIGNLGTRSTKKGMEELCHH